LFQFLQIRIVSWYTCRILSTFFALFFGLWGILVPFIARKSSSFSFLERAMYILGHWITSTVTLFPMAARDEEAGAVATQPSCSDCTEAESPWLLFILSEACCVVENALGFGNFADPEEATLLLLLSMPEEETFGAADLDTTGLLPWLFLEGDSLPPKEGSSKFLSPDTQKIFQTCFLTTSKISRTKKLHYLVWIWSRSNQVLQQV